MSSGTNREGEEEEEEEEEEEGGEQQRDITQTDSIIVILIFDPVCSRDLKYPSSGPGYDQQWTISTNILFLQ